MMLSSDNVSFAVVSGPGKLQGTHNGDPHSQLANSAPTHPAYHGLVRAVVRVTSVAARATAERAALAKIDHHGPMAAGASTAAAALVEGAQAAAEPIVVEARAPGLAPARVSIPVSTDVEADGILSVAEAGAGKQVDFFATSAPQ
jgi:hypothetical protein